MHSSSCLSHVHSHGHVAMACRQQKWRYIGFLKGKTVDERLIYTRDPPGSSGRLTIQSRDSYRGGEGGLPPPPFRKFPPPPFESAQVLK